MDERINLVHRILVVLKGLWWENGWKNKFSIKNSSCFKVPLILCNLIIGNIIQEVENMSSKFVGLANDCYLSKYKFRGNMFTFLFGQMEYTNLETILKFFTGTDESALND